MKLEKLNSLTSLRFFAAACIVFGHAQAVFGVKLTTIALQQGVSLFFVLSGFILAYNYREFSNISEYLLFYKARFARIWPLHISCILIMVLIVPKNMIYANFKLLIENLLLIQGWIPIRNTNLSVNGVAWSISTEFFFYLCFPFIIKYIRKYWPIILIVIFGLLVAMISISNFYHLSNDSSLPGVSNFSTIYVSPLSRIFEFYIGVSTLYLFNWTKKLFADIEKWKSTFLEFIAVILAIFSMWFTPKIAYTYELNAAIGQPYEMWMKSSGSVFAFALLIYIFALQNGKITSFLSTRIFIILGEISFATYLIHTIILNFFSSRNLHQLIPSPLNSTIYYIAVIIASYLLWRFIEKIGRAHV